MPDEETTEETTEPRVYPYAMTADDYELFHRAAGYKAESGDLDPDGVPYTHDLDGLLRIVRDWGHMIGDKAATQAYVDNVEAEAKAVHVAAIDAEHAALHE